MKKTKTTLNGFVKKNRSVLGKVFLIYFFSTFSLGLNAQSKIEANEANNFKIVNSKIFNVSSAKLWKIISDKGGLSKVHSYTKNVEVIKWNGKETIDRLTYYSGMKLDRRFFSWIEGVGYDITIIHYAVNGSEEDLGNISFRIKDMGKNKSELTITARPTFPPEVATIAQKKEALETGYKPDIDKYFQSLLNGIEYYLKTGKVVKRNQFGGPLEPYSSVQ